MTKPANQPRSFAAEEESTIDLAAIQELLELLQKDSQARDLSSLSVEQAKMLASMPNKLREYLQIVEQIKKEKVEEKEIADPRKQLEKKKETEAKLEKLAKEVFIVACSSSLPIETALDFHEKCNLGVKGLNEFGDNGLNPLAAAIACGRSQADLDKILEKGADINFKSPQGSNAAHFAVMYGADASTIDFLVERGVDINAKNNFGMTPLDMAVLKGDKELVEKLVEKGGKLSRLSSNEKEQEAEKQRQQERSRKKETKLPKDKKDDHELVELKEAKEKAQQELQMRSEAEARIALDLAQEVRALAAKIKSEKQRLEEDQKAKPVVEEVKVVVEPVRPAEIVVVEPSKSKEREFLEKLLGVDFDKIDINQLLFKSVANGNSMVAVYLVLLGADVNHKENGVSVLEAAVSRGDNSLVGAFAHRANPQTVKSALENVGTKSELIRGILEDAVSKAPKVIEVSVEKEPAKLPKDVVIEESRVARDHPKAEVKEEPKVAARPEPRPDVPSTFVAPTRVKALVDSVALQASQPAPKKATEVVAEKKPAIVPREAAKEPVKAGARPSASIAPTSSRAIVNGNQKQAGG